MKNNRLALTIAFLIGAIQFSIFNIECSLGTASAQDTLFVRYDDRFKPNGIISLVNVDSVSVLPRQLRAYTTETALGYRNIQRATIEAKDREMNSCLLTRRR